MKIKSTKSKYRKINFNNIYWSVIFLMIALPLHASNKLLNYLSITGAVSIFHFIVIGMMIASLFHILKIRGLYISAFFILLIAIGIISGSKSGSSMNNIMGDGGMYLLSFGVFLPLCSKKVTPKSMDEILEFVLQAMTVSCTISIIMYLTRGLAIWGMESYNGGRYFGGYLSLLEFSIPYAIYYLLYKNRNKPWRLIYHIIIGFICMIIAQSRTTVFCVLIGGIFTFLFGNKGNTKGQFSRKILIFALAFIALYIVFESNLDIIERIRGTNLRSSSETTFARLYLYQYYIPIIARNIIGVGFGQQIYFITQNLLLNSDVGGYTVDSSILTVGYKVGWVGIILYTLMFLIPVIYYLRKFLRSKERIYLIILVQWILFTFSTSVLTAQTIHTYACLTLSWVMVGNVLRLKGLEDGNKKKSGVYLSHYSKTVS